MNYAIIENNAVVNMAVAEKDFADQQGWVEIPDEFGIGDLYEDGQFKKAPIDLEALANQVRAERDYCLVTFVDPLVTNPLRWNALTPEKQQEWIDYRQALLDIPEQEGFPTNVIWPMKPE